MTNYDELRQAEAKAAPGSWSDDEGDTVCDVNDWPIVTRIDADGTRSTEGTRDDIAFIVLMRNNFLALLDENEALRRALADHEYCQWDGIRGGYCQSCEARAGDPHTELCSWKTLGDASCDDDTVKAALTDGTTFTNRGAEWERDDFSPCPKCGLDKDECGDCARV